GGRRGGDGPCPDGPAGPAPPRGRRALSRPWRPDHGRWPPGDRLGQRDADGRPPRRRGCLTMVTRKSRSEIERMRKAGRVVGEILDIIEAEIRPGVSTDHLGALA